MLPRFLKTFFTAALVLLLAGVMTAPSVCAKQSRAMIGNITHINAKYETVVVEVPIGDDLFTVAGPIHSETTLKKNGRSVSLDAFQNGDKVKVRWHTTDSGHIIDGMVYPAGR